MNNLKNEKKIRLDLNIEINQENIKCIFENLIKSENIFNEYLNVEKEISNRNYSPCYIISKVFINEFKQLFNYDYFEKNEIFNMDIILHQRKNNKIIYLNDLQEITVDDFKNNNIVILNEITFISLYNIIPDLDRNKNKYIICDIYLKQNKGILCLIKNENNYLYIFETNNYINNIKNYDLINFNSNKNDFSEIKKELDKNNISDDIWNKLIYDYCNNCNFIIDKNKDNINMVLKKLENKIKKYKLYFQNNQSIENAIISEKIKGFENALNLYEIYINKKNIYINQIISNNTNNNNININQNIINNKNFNIENNNINNYNNNIIDNKIIINNINYNLNNNINNIKINNFNKNNKNIKIDPDKPSLGLGNIGSSCYMNATLQSLAHIRELSEELLNFFDKDNNSDLNKLTYHYISLLKNIYFPKSNRGFFAPYDIKNIIGIKESLFRGNEAEDAKDLYLFLIETMNYELNGEKNQIYNDIIRLGVDLRDKFLVKNTFLNEFRNKNNISPFAKYLYGFSQTCSECLKCGIKKYNYECFNFINFPLLDIKNYIKKCKVNYNDRYILNIEDCLLYNQKMEIYNGNNKMMCNNCNSFQDGRIQRLIDIAPSIFVIILDRGIDNMNFNENFNFDEYLDLSQFIQDKNNSCYKYYLSGVITHIGKSGKFGHFVAFSKMDINSLWYLYNDSSVKQCKDINEVLNFGKPYILFYHFINN